MKKLCVIELFAGVGGFRLGLDAVKIYGKKAFETVWSNQWEPGAKFQFASEIYRDRFKEGVHSNDDIATVSVNDIPNDVDVLVGGFPCQDYSVARTLNQAQGIVGKKGVLWWQINRILSKKKKKPIYLILENVDRLLKSPASQRGRDYAIMLASLAKLGYAVEWKVINAAEYGFPQKRRRVFFFGYYRTTKQYKKIAKYKEIGKWLSECSLINKVFPGDIGNNYSKEFILGKDIFNISEYFGKTETKDSFENTGFMINRKVFTVKTKAIYNGVTKTLMEIVKDSKDVPEEYYIVEKDIKKWEKLKGAKKLQRKDKNTGHVYYYSEGAIPFPDPLDRPARTIITGEGGSTPSRFKHVIKDKNGRLRRLLPSELEKINGFPEGHTEYPNVNSIKRAFLMGNALVVGIITKLGWVLAHEINNVRK